LDVFSFAMKHTLVVLTSSSEALSKSHIAFMAFFLLGFLEVESLLFVSVQSVMTSLGFRQL